MRQFPDYLRDIRPSLRDHTQFYKNLPTILLHPQTVIHEIKEILPRPFGDGSGYFYANDDDGKSLNFSVKFTAPLEADFFSDEHDQPGTKLTSREFLLLLAATHPDSLALLNEGFAATDTTYTTKVYIKVPRKPDWGLGCELPESTDPVWTPEYMEIYKRQSDKSD